MKQTKSQGKFFKKYGPWALIAGGSEGIGGAWADHAASQGLSVVLLARNVEKLEKKRDEIVNTYGVEVHRVILSRRLGRENHLGALLVSSPTSH